MTNSLREITCFYRAALQESRCWGGRVWYFDFSRQNSAFWCNFVFALFCTNSKVLFAIKCRDRYVITSYSWQL